MMSRHAMLTNPAYCLAGDSVDTVRDMMDFAQLNQLPVVENRERPRLLGLVRRDDLELVAPESPVRDVMDPTVPVLREEEALDAFPVVDRDGFLKGLVPVGPHAPRSGVWPLAGAALAAAGIGAGLMFLLDPAQGRRRRAVARDKAGHWMRVGEKAWGRTTKDLANRVQGWRVELDHRLHPGAVTDAKLAARVRTRLGRLTDEPQRIEVAAHDGTVVLRGIAPAREVERLEQGVRSVDGVRAVENQLAVAS